MTDPVALRNQRAFGRRNAKLRAQSPRAECVLESFHELVYSFSGARGDRHATGNTHEVGINHFAVWQIINLIENDQRLLAVSVEFFDYPIDGFHLLVRTRVT